MQQYIHPIYSETTGPRTIMPLTIPVHDFPLGKLPRITNSVIHKVGNKCPQRKSIEIVVKWAGYEQILHDVKKLEFCHEEEMFR